MLCRLMVKRASTLACYLPQYPPRLDGGRSTPVSLSTKKLFPATLVWPPSCAQAHCWTDLRFMSTLLKRKEAMKWPQSNWQECEKRRA